MRKKNTFLVISIFLISFTVFSQKIVLPIEVLGAERTVERVTFTIDQEQFDKISSTNNLWLRINNLGYEDKASVHVNNGTWISLNHNSTEIASPEKERGGMSNGGYNTIRLSVTISNLTIGENIVRFRFNESDGISNGFRVIDMDLLDDSSQRILKNSSYYVTPQGTREDGISYFEEDDPLLWNSPFFENGSEPADLGDKAAQGKNLWYYGRNGSPSQQGEDLISNYLDEGETGFWYGYELKAAQPIRAKCASCHIHDGRDLEIFSYSNRSIIERSKFHGLTEEEGELITAYIRSLSEDSPDSGNIGRYGRPWNPPYQPGPQLAGKPIEQWAAGAGLDAVLEEDAEMFPYLFPNGDSQEEIYKVFDSEGTSDKTEIPLAIQLPDWKHWLPIVHPMDAYTKDDYWNDSSKQFDPKQGYIDFRKHITDNLTTYQRENITIQQANTLMQANNDFHRHYRQFLADGSSNRQHWRTEDGTATSKIADDIPRELAATSLARLMAVQFFEIMNEFNFQDKARWFTEHPEEDQPKERQWFGRNYQVFEVPPHFQASVESEGSNGDSRSFKGQSLATGQFESTNWYELQAVINAGEGMIQGVSPVDYNYQNMFILRAGSSSGINEPLRYYKTLNTMYQTRTWSGGKNPNETTGFRIRNMGPWFFYGMTFRNDYEDYEPGEFANLLNDISSGLQTKITNAQILQFLTEVEDGSADTDGYLYNEGTNRLYNKSDGSMFWLRTGLHGDTHKLDSKDKTEGDMLFDSRLLRDNKVERWADKFYYLIPIFYDLDVDNNLMNRMINWCAAAWPLINWEVLREESLSTNSYETGKDIFLTHFQNSDYLKIHNLTNESCQIKVYDLLGKVQWNKQKTIVDNTTLIDTQSLSSGIYILNIQGYHNVKSIKFYKK